MSGELHLALGLPVGEIVGTPNMLNPRRYRDALNLRYQWGASGDYGIPTMAPCQVIPDDVVAWNAPPRERRAQAGTGALHFYLHDYRFEQVWDRPEATLGRVLEVGTAFTPDFSLYRDMPRATQIWQTYRSRWMGAFWQYNGVNAIPTLMWGDTDTYDFVFEGLPEGGVYALSTVGVRDAFGVTLFRRGVTETVRRLNPTALLVYGPTSPLLDGLDGLPRLVRYKSFWELRRPIVEEKSSWRKQEEPAPPAEDAPCEWVQESLLTTWPGAR